MSAGRKSCTRAPAFDGSWWSIRRDRAARRIQYPEESETDGDEAQGTSSKLPIDNVSEVAGKKRSERELAEGSNAEAQILACGC